MRPKVTTLKWRLKSTAKPRHQTHRLTEWEENDTESKQLLEMLCAKKSLEGQQIILTAPLSDLLWTSLRKSVLQKTAEKTMPTTPKTKPWVNQKARSNSFNCCCCCAPILFPLHFMARLYSTQLAVRWFSTRSYRSSSNVFKIVQEHKWSVCLQCRMC